MVAGLSRATQQLKHVYVMHNTAYTAQHAKHVDDTTWMKSATVTNKLQHANQKGSESHSRQGTACTAHHTSNATAARNATDYNSMSTWQSVISVAHTSVAYRAQHAQHIHSEHSMHSIQLPSMHGKACTA